MTYRCEFGLGNRGFARVAMGTVSGSNPLAVAAQMQTRRRQRKRTQCSTVSSLKEGRASANYAKTITVPHPQSTCGAASSVSRRSHAGKAIQDNLGDPMVPRAVTQLSCLTALVALTISSLSEGSGNASWGVGEARSIGEGGDSITLLERRSLACMRDCSEFMNEPILPQGSKRRASSEVR